MKKKNNINIMSIDVYNQKISNFLKFLEEDLNEDFLSSLSTDDKLKIFVDLQMIAEGLKKVMLLSKK